MVSKALKPFQQGEVGEDLSPQRTTASPLEQECRHTVSQSSRNAGGWNRWCHAPAGTL